MTEFIEVKTAELEGAALDWAVALAVDWAAARIQPIITPSKTHYEIHAPSGLQLNPSVSWARGGPLIDEYKPWLSPPVGNDQDDEPYGWDAEIYGVDGSDQLSHIIGAPTALIAACRAIVAAKLGETVRVPVELMK